MGYIYILTNPSFKEYIKIGYATDVDQRLKVLNSNPGLPFAFRVYATYEVDSDLSDKKLHSILDKLNPDLRSIEEYEGKTRKREFYAMSPEDAYAILEAIAEINGYKDRLKKWVATAEEKKSEAIANEISEEHKERMSAFAFSKCNISAGEEIEFSCRGNENDGVVCRVVDDKHVEYKGEVMSLTALAKQLMHCNNSIAGPRYFKYKSEWLNDIRERLGV